MLSHEHVLYINTSIIDPGLRTVDRPCDANEDVLCTNISIIRRPEALPCDAMPNVFVNSTCLFDILMTAWRLGSYAGMCL